MNTIDQSIQRLNKVPERLLIHNPRLEQVKLFELYQRLKSRLLGIEIGLSLARFSKYDIDFLSNFPTIQYDHNIFYNELKNINLNCKIQARSIFASGILTSKYIKKVCDNPDFKFLVDDKRSEWYKPPRSHMISAVTKIMHHLLINNYADYSIEKAAFKFVESCKPNYLVLGFSNISHVDQVLSWVECKSICVNLFKNLNLISSSKIQLW